MNEQQIADANHRLADPPDLDVSVTRRMGLYVVARLAQRHGIEVRLRENEDIDGGVIARIVVPAELLAEAPSTEQLRRLQAAEEAQQENEAPPAFVAESAPPPPRSAPEPAPARDGGLVPLEQPISLDDLVGGTVRAAGPFLSPGRESHAAPEPGYDFDETYGTRETQWPVSEPSAEVEDGPRAGTGTAEEETSYLLALPKNEPRYVPVAPEPPEQASSANGGGSALDDDVPTRRLPIYQSVLSRWFSESGDQQPEETTPQADVADGAEAAPVEPPEQPERAQQPERTQRPEGIDVAEGWGAATGNGWQAAQALLESKDEEITPAGLPKRVPNANLVPGSVARPEGGAFTDTTSGQPGQGAIARSAAAARSRMVSFQRGYQSGRHALRETPAEAHERDVVGVNGVGERSGEHRVKE
jgi:hypothetical protein